MSWMPSSTSARTTCSRIGRFPTGIMTLGSEAVKGPIPAPLSHPEAWKILCELARKPDYPGAVAKRLRMHEQTAYYHVHRLAKAGLIHVVREERRQGAVSRVFAPSAEAFGVELPGPTRARAAPSEAVPERVRMFLEPFLREGGLLAIGSPYQPGPFLTVPRGSP